MAVSVGDVVRITARMLLDGVDDVINVYHFVVDTNTTANDEAFMTEVAQEIQDLYVTINSRVSDRISYESVEGFNVTQTLLLPPRPFPSLSAGADAGVMLPEMNAACCFHRTTTPRVRASKFLPPTTESSNDGGALGVTYEALVQNFAAFLLAAVVGPNIALDYIAFNRALSTFVRVSSSVVPSRFRTQRRRRIGVGS